MNKSIKFKSGVFDKHTALEKQITKAEQNITDIANSDECEWNAGNDISDSDPIPIAPDFSDNADDFDKGIETIRDILDSPKSKFVDVFGQITDVKSGEQIVKQHMKKAGAIVKSLLKNSHKLNNDIKTMHKKHHKTSVHVRRDRSRIIEIINSFIEHERMMLERNIEPNNLTKKLDKISKLSDKIFSHGDRNRAEFTFQTIKLILALCK